MGKNQEAAPGGQGLSQRIADLSFAIEKMNLAEYTALLKNPWRLMLVNFMAGMARGLGSAVGFTILGAMLIYLLSSAVMRNLPLVGDFIAEIVRMVQWNLNR